MSSTRPLSLVHTEGEASRQAHTQLPANSFEREIGREGFFGPATQMYHRHPPTAWSAWTGPLRPRAYDLNRAADAGASPLDAGTILHNARVKIRHWSTDQAMDHLVRNADGDELLFVHRGAGEFYCDYGHLSFRQGDYLVVPRGTLWRIEPSDPVWLLLIEATHNAFKLPDRGLAGQQAIFDPALLDAPRIDARFKAQYSEDPWRVDIQHQGRRSTVRFPFNPLDAIGWSGDLCPLRINIADIRPLMSHRYHLPPSAHTTFVAPGFVVCSFVPRPFESDPDCLKVPFFHSNDDFDEVIFYHAGDFFSRDHIEPGMLSFHPAGFTHGPHPGALKNMLHQSKPATDEYAVMIDSRDPLTPGEAMSACEISAYVDSWQARP